MKLRSLSIACAFACATSVAVAADDHADGVDIGKLYTGSFRVDQATLATMSRDEIRLAGMRMFTKQFNKAEGFGDGVDLNPTGNIGERSTIQGNGTFQRINGLDAQSCLECHSVISNRITPAIFGVGGVGSIAQTVLGAGGGTLVDLASTDPKTNVNGRVINPPFIFGAGGVELLANEMTAELNAQLAAAPANATTPLSAKGISFGEVTKDASGNIVTDVDGDAVGVTGVFDARPIFNGAPNTDFLVVAPFGRTGDAKSTRTFDNGALRFHFGMSVDGGADNDGDGVVNEVLTGELSALSVFVATAETPVQKKPKGAAREGLRLMNDAGCTSCHKPTMETNGKTLGFRSPEIGNDPSANVYYSVDLTKKPMSFEENGKGGLVIPLFADLKRHYMGQSLAEFNGNAMFTTMRLWGVADTGPYLHDGRALTIREAIVMHGADADSEANAAVTSFNNMPAADQEAILAFLDTLRSPRGKFTDLEALAHKVAQTQGVK